MDKSTKDPQDFWEDSILKGIRNIITTQQAADYLRISRRRIIALIKANRLPARKFGRDWWVNKADLKLVKDRSPGYPKGRPRKSSPASK